MAPPDPPLPVASRLLGRQAIHALKALLELAEAPPRWRSVAELAAARELPAPLLEQLLLRLRRAGLLLSRRGRRGGYRLALSPADIPLAAVLRALRPPGQASGPASAEAGSAVAESALAESGEDGAPDRAPDAAERVTQLLERRLRRALEQELSCCTLADLVHDLRSARALLEDDGGLLLG